MHSDFLIQNGKKKNIVDQILGGGGGGRTPAAAPSGSATGEEHSKPGCNYFEESQYMHLMDLPCSQLMPFTPSSQVKY